MSTLSIDVDDFLLHEAIPVLAEHGISPAGATRLLLYVIARDKRLPFEIDSPMMIREDRVGDHGRKADEFVVRSHDPDGHEVSLSVEVLPPE
jgi:antitoxin component of RelBE/YafQ-DinJ toxin-antitoxin module